MDGTNKFKNMIVGFTLVALILVIPIREATAGTAQENCVSVGNVAMKVAEFRDVGVPLELVIGKLVEAGMDSNMAVKLTVLIYDAPQADRVTIGKWFYSFCMEQYGEAS